MQEGLMNITFYVFAAITILCAMMVITQNNPVRSILYLVAAFFTSAVLWIMVNAEFLALILILVYVGAVMTLFLFVVMMLNIDIETKSTHKLRYLPFGLILVALLASLLIIVIPKTLFTNAAETTVNQAANLVQASNTLELGEILYTNYLLAFEMAAAILLVAIIAAITLVHRDPIRSKRQNVVAQIMTRRQDRVKLVKMKS